jgi:hypothetical protein
MATDRESFYDFIHSGNGYLIDDAFGVLVHKMETITGAVNSATAQTLDNWVDLWNDHMVNSAIRRQPVEVVAHLAIWDAIQEGIDSAKGGRPNNKYITAILERWIREGHKSDLRSRYNGKDQRNDRKNESENEPTEADRRAAARISGA